jgi:tryptophan-rich sensory protein
VSLIIINIVAIEKSIPLQILKLIVSLALCQCAGLVGSVFTMSAIPTWYASIKKPPFTPPNWLFAPVWLTLYVLMGIALFLVWRKGLAVSSLRMACIIFIVQLILNALWSICFFGLRSPLIGLIVIVLLWIAILLTIILFSRVELLASYLLIPYIVWVSYAALLNASIFILNKP